MDNKIKNYLGIDWGSADIGVAFADGETKMAFTYKKLKNDKKTILKEISEIIKKEEIGTVVIGVPAYINKQEITYPGERLGEEIKKVSNVEVVYQNEMFSTKVAETNLRERGLKKIKRFDDAEAARVILESYLDKIV